MFFGQTVFSETPFFKYEVMDKVQKRSDAGSNSAPLNNKGLKQ
jgi:hypothetical protein